MGDVLLTTPIVRQLRRDYPNSYITFLTNWKSEKLLAGNPDIDEIVVNPAHLAGRAFDQRIELWYEYDPNLHIVDAYAKCAQVTLQSKDYVLALEPKHRDFAARLCAEQGFRSDDLILGVHAQATWPNRLWPREHFLAVLEHFRDRRQAKVIEFGTDPDTYLNVGLNLIGRCGLKQTAAVLERCTLLLCVDSLLLHLAGAVRTPTVCVFGPVFPQTRLPFNEVSVGCIRSELSCIGCHHRSPVPARRTDCIRERVYCMEELRPETVITEIEKLLAGTRAPAQTLAVG